MPAVEGPWAKVTRHDSDVSFFINQTLTSPVKGWPLVLGKMQICALSTAF